MADVFLTKIYKKIVDANPLHLKKIAIKHPVYHHTFIKNTKLDAYFRDKKYTIFTNSLGFKDKQIRDIKSKFEFKRIIFIGDSFTEGVSLNYEDTFVGIIAQELNKKGIDVLNAGRGSYSPIIYYAKIKYLIENQKLKFDEIFIIPDISDYADEYFNYEMDSNGNVVSKENLKSDKRFNNKNFDLKGLIRNNTTIIYFFSNYIHGFIYGNYDEEYKKNPWFFLINKKLHWLDKWTIHESEYNRYAIHGEKKMRLYMQKLIDLLNKNNVKINIVVYPHISQVWYEDLNSKHVNIWKNFSYKNNINFINLFPLFVKKNIDEESKINLLKENYIIEDTHFNEAGNKKIAEFILTNYGK